MSREVAAVIERRLSTRQFLASPAPTVEEIAELLLAANRAPSGGNTQPWHVYVVSGDARAALVTKAKAALGENTGEFSVYPDASASGEYMDRRRKLAADMYELMGVDRHDREARMEALLRNFDFFGAPVGLFITVDRIVDRNGWGHVGHFLQNVCLLAEERGMATCLQEAWAAHSTLIKTELGIPESEILWCGVALGYPDKSAAVNKLRSERRPLHEFARFFGFEEDRVGRLPAKL